MPAGRVRHPRRGEGILAAPARRRNAVTEESTTLPLDARKLAAEANARARWNRASNAEINDDLAADDCLPDAAPDLPSALGCEPGGLAEAYFEDARDGPRRWDCGSGADGTRRPRESEGDGGIDPAQPELLRLGVAAEIPRLAAREPGSVTGGWLRWAESVLPSRIDWRQVLAAEIRSAVAAVARQVRVVVGLLTEGAGPPGWAPSAWARTVIIEAAVPQPSDHP